MSLGPVRALARCIHCGAETELYVQDVPVCTACDGLPPIRTSLPQAGIRLDEARAKWRAAKLELEKMTELHADLQPGHPDTNRGLARANALLKEAAAEFQEALREYLNAGRKPE